MTRAPGDPSQFIITVHSNDNKKERRFRTRKIISSFGTEPLRGRGTRVYEAIEVDEYGKEMGDPVVLKDIWIDHDRMREGTILAQLYEDADEDDKKLVKNHFLTTVCLGDVLIEPSVADDTWVLMRGLKTTPGIEHKLQEKPSMESKHKVASGSQSLRAMSRLHVPHPNLTYSHKTHYRIVFKEKGITVLSSLRVVMGVLADIVTGAFLPDYSQL